jgi:hypothetical protein
VREVKHAFEEWASFGINPYYLLSTWKHIRSFNTRQCKTPPLDMISCSIITAYLSRIHHDVPPPIFSEIQLDIIENNRISSSNFFSQKSPSILDLFYPNSTEPIIAAARSKARTVFTRSNARIVGSNPTQSMDVCVRLFCACVVLCVGSVLSTGWLPVQGVLPTAYMFKKLKKAGRDPTKALQSHA